MKLLICLGLLLVAHLALADTNLCGTFTEDRSVYSTFDNSNGHDIANIEITTDATSGFTWDQLTANLDPKANIVVNGQVKTASGTTTPVTIERMGDFGKQTTLPSLRVKFTNAGTLYNGATDRLLLDKNPNDNTRMHNKVTFELLQKVTGMPSQVTKLMTVSVNGASQGIYTFIEDIRKEWLNYHKLNKDSYLFKANNVSWNLAVDNTVTQPPNPYTAAFEKSFEARWDIRGAKTDFSSLINAYKDLYDPNTDSATVMSTRFNTDNFATWLAFVYLIAHAEIDEKGFAVFSPVASATCKSPTPLYMLQWDNSAAWDNYLVSTPALTPNVDYAPYTKGIQYLWNKIRPVKKFLDVNANVDLLEAKMKTLVETVLTGSAISAITADLKTKMEPSLQAAPDNNPAYNSYNSDINVWAANVDLMAKIPAAQWARWTNYKKTPMPFSQRKTTSTDKSSIYFHWDRSFILYNKNITYELQIADNEQFNNPVLKETTTEAGIAVSMDKFAASTKYYWKVTACNADETSPDATQPYCLMSKDSLNKTGGYGLSDFTTDPTIVTAVAAPAVVNITNKQPVQSETGATTFNYATVDNLAPSALEADRCVDEKFFVLPAGWYLAPNTAQTRYHLFRANQPWGGSQFILADGERVTSNGAFVDGYGEDVGQFLNAKRFSDNTVGYAVSCRGIGEARLLITDNNSQTDAPTLTTPAPNNTSSAATQVLSLFFVAVCVLAALL